MISHWALGNGYGRNDNRGLAPNATHFGTAGAISCSGVAQATRFFMSFLAQHRTARAQWHSL